MDEYNQGRRYSQNTLNISISHPDLLANVSSDRHRKGPQLGLPVSAQTLGNSVSADDQYYSNQISTFLRAESLLVATQTSSESEYDPKAAGADARQQQQQQTAALGSHNTNMMMYSVPQTNTQTSIYNTSYYPMSELSRNSLTTSAWRFSDQADTYQSHFRALFAGVSSATAPPEQGSTEACYQVFPELFYHFWGVAGEGNAGTGTGTGGLTGVENFFNLANLGTEGAANMPETSEVDKVATLEGKWQDYQRRLADVFKETIAGNLERAADRLLSVSFWLLSRVEELGLTDDDETLQNDHLKLWQDFNHAWIGLIFKQKQHMQQSLQQSSVPQPLPLRTVTRMGDELIRLCDGIERHGLVDYQLGVWEDEIETLLEDCLVLFENGGEARSETNRDG